MSKVVHLYGGNEVIEFDDDRHCYVHREKGLPVAGVTSILGGAIPKEALLPWGCKMTSEYIQKGIIRRLEAGEPIETTWILSLCQEGKTAWRTARDEAGNRGTDVHAFAERALVDRKCKLPDDPQTRNGCIAFLDWLHTANLELIEAERIVFSKTWWYCGTTDLFGRLNGKLSVCDFKSGSGFYDEHPLQLAAYAVALEEETGERIEDGLVIHLDKKTGKPTPYPVPITRGLKDSWLRVREAYEAIQKTRQMVKEMKDGLRKRAA